MEEIKIYKQFNEETQEFWYGLWDKCSKQELKMKLFSANGHCVELQSKLNNAIDDIRKWNFKYENENTKYILLNNKLDKIIGVLEDKIKECGEFVQWHSDDSDTSYLQGVKNGMIRTYQEILDLLKEDS